MPTTRTITVRGVPDRVLSAIRRRGEAHRRSLNSEVLEILDRAASTPAEPTPRQVRETATTGYRAPAMPAANARVRPGRRLDWVDRKALAVVCRRYRVAWLAVFGSTVRGDERPDSDVDVVVDFERGATPGFGIVALADALSPLFGGVRVDLSTRRGLARTLREHILATAVTLHGA